MALRNSGTTPAFESEGDTAVAERPEPSVTVEVEVQKPAASTAVAERPAAAVVIAPKVGNSFSKEVEALKGAADFSYGNFTVFKGIQGEIKGIGDSTASLGRWAKGTMIAWDEHFEISPGSKTEKSKDAVAYSKDGITVDNVVGEDLRQWQGKAVADYVAYLKSEMDYDQAGSRRFIDVAFAVLETESNEEFVGEIIQVTLSQSSIPSFKKYQEKLVQTARCVERGVPGFKVPEDPFTFYFLRQAASKGDNDWTKLEVLIKLPAKI